MDHRRGRTIQQRQEGLGGQEGAAQIARQHIIEIAGFGFRQRNGQPVIARQIDETVHAAPQRLQAGRSSQHGCFVMQIDGNRGTGRLVTLQRCRQVDHADFIALRQQARDQRPADTARAP